MPKASDFMYVLSLFAAMGFFVPSLIMFQLAGTTVYIPLLSLLFIFFLNWKYLTIPSIKSVRVRYQEQKIILITLSILMLIPFVKAYGFSINSSVLSFGNELYEVRAEARLHSNIFTAYLLGPLTKIFLPSLIIYGLIKKQKLLWIIGTVFMLYLFLVNPHKSVFLSIIVVFIFFYFKDYKAKAGLMLIGFLLVFAGTLIFSRTSGNILPESIFVRRLFFLPVYISDYYFSFFQDNHIYLSHSFLGPLIDYPYHLGPTLLMGEQIYQNPETSCNTGIIGDGFMNFGIIGSIIFVFIAAIFLKFLDSLRMHHSFFGLSFLYLVLFMNSALFTTLLTHAGLLFILLGIFFFKNTNTASK
ncbi:MAG: O-antigen ligase [Bacteroidales bacterium]|nr:O-antigen ligase [Bacteroidales bacterium]